MSSSSSSSSSHRSNEMGDCGSSTMNNITTDFAPLHRTMEIENLPDQIDHEQNPTSFAVTTTKKILTKCLTVIGDGSDK